MRYAWLGGLALSALPITTATSQAHDRVVLAGPSISIGFGHHEHHDFVRPIRPFFFGGFCGPRIVIGPSFYCPPPVVYAAPPTIVYTTPAPVYAPQYYQVPAAAPVPVPQPVPQPAPSTYYYGQ